MESCDAQELSETFYRPVLFLEYAIAIMTMLVLVGMLINLTPANTLEVLIVAIARQVIVNHNDPISNIACVLCIGGLFAIRIFLISKSDFKKELSEDTIDTQHVCNCNDEQTADIN